MSPENHAEEQRDAGCICQRWPMMVMAVAFFLFGAVGCVVSYAFLQEKSLVHKHHYGIIIDAGSSHTDITVYKWPSDSKYKGTAKVKQIAFSTCSSSGISSFKDNPEQAGLVISTCIDTIAIKSVPKHDRSQTPIYVGATAGMRLLCARKKNACDQVMQAVTGALDKSEFKHNNQSARILTGKEEGVFGWMTVNLLKKRIANKQDDHNNASTFGALDMGGASAEISFIPKAGTSVPEQYSKKLKVYGDTYPLYTHSFLCFGLKEAERRLLASLVQRSGYATNVTNPCYPAGFMRTVFAYDIWMLPCSMKPKSNIFPLNPDQEYLITGTSDPNQCREIIRSLFNETECEFGSCSFNGAYQPELFGHFLAFSGYGFVTSFLNVTKIDSIANLGKSGQAICKDDWLKLKKNHPATADKYLHKYCFDAEYIYQILTYGFHFQEDSKRVTFVNQIRGTDVGWSLGFMVNATNLIPIEHPKSKLGRRNYIFLTGLSVLIVVFSLILCFCYSVKKLRKKDSDYEYRPLDYDG